MIKAVVGVDTQVKWTNEDGDEVNRFLYVVVDVPGILRPGDRLCLPTPRHYEAELLQEFKVEFCLIVGDVLLVRGKTQNHYMDQLVHDELLQIGYSIELPSILLKAKEALLR